MGAFGAFFVALFSLCFRKLKTRAQTVSRLIVLLIAFSIFIIVILIVGNLTGWNIFFIFALLFGWRMVVDIVLIIRNKFEPPSEEQDKSDDGQDE